MVGEYVELDGHWDSVSAMVLADEVKVCLFLGYAEWRKQQLQNELDEGSRTLYRGINTKQILMDWQDQVTMKRREIAAYLESVSPE